MFALLDVDRACRAFATFTAPDGPAPSPQPGGADQTRSRSLRELSTTLPEDLAWLYDVPEGPQNWRTEREIFSVVEPLPAPGHDIFFHINTRFRPVIRAAQRSTRVLIQIEFDGRNWCNMLATEDPPHSVVLHFLRRVQPVHAFVALDMLNPGDDLPGDPGSYVCFRESWRRMFDSTFLGPELTRLIPRQLIDTSNGFSHVERVGEGVWITFKGEGSRLGREGNAQEEEIFERHHTACQRLTDFLQTLPPDATG